MCVCVRERENVLVCACVRSCVYTEKPNERARELWRQGEWAGIERDCVSFVWCDPIGACAFVCAYARVWCVCACARVVRA